MTYEVRAGHLVPLGRTSAFALHLNGVGVLEADPVPAVARMRLGGSGSIRGYAEEAFLATRALWANAEWRRPLGRRSRAFLYVDAGVLNDPDGQGRGRVVYPVGYGAGLMAESRIGLVQLGYGLSKGERPGQGRVHVRLVGGL